MKQILLAFMLLAAIKSNGQSNVVDTTYLKINRDSVIHLFSGKFFSSTKNENIGTVDKYTNLNLADPNYITYPIIFQTGNKPSAYLKSGSDTLEVFDSVIQLYGSKIRYIKTMNGSIIKL